MDAEQSLRDGDTSAALAQLQQRVRGDPSDAKARIFLFQLLAVLGQTERALKQLNVVGELEAKALPMVQMYSDAIRCELFRDEVFAGNKTPLLLGEPDQWVALMLEALRLDAQGSHAQAQALRDQAFEAAPATGGTIDDAPFAWIADADTRLGPLLEAIVNGRYYWVPFAQIAEVSFDPPEDLRDVVWMPAHFRWANGGETVGLVPTRYPGSQNCEDPRLVLARRTEWDERPGDGFEGFGQRMFATDEGEYPIMDIRRIVLETG